MRTNRLSVVLSILAIGAQLGACARTPVQTAPAMHAHYTTAGTPIGTLLKDPAAVAAIERQMPGFTTADKISMASGMTLRQVQRFRPDVVTNEKLVALDADFQKIPAQ